MLNRLMIAFISQLLISFSVYAQSGEGKIIMIYAEDEDYLLPYIENTLSDLRSMYDENEGYFNIVVNLNRLENNIEEQIKIRKGIAYFSREEKLYSISEKGNEVYQKIENSLSNYNLYLKININTLNSYLEYQFTLYNTSTSKADDELAVNIVDKPIKTESLFIDIGDSNYKLILKNALLSLFEDTNQPPKVRVRVNTKLYNFQDTLYFAEDQPITLDLSESDDVDSYREQFIYSWEQIDLEGRKNIPFGRQIYLENTNTPIQRIEEGLKIGSYKIGVTISDGITSSRKDTILFKIVQRPTIILPNNSNEIRLRQPPIKLPLNITGLQDSLNYSDVLINPVEYKMVNQSSRGIEILRDKEAISLNVSDSHPRGKYKYAISANQYGILGEPVHVYVNKRYTYSGSYKLFIGMALNSIISLGGTFEDTDSTAFVLPGLNSQGERNNLFQPFVSFEYKFLGIKVFPVFENIKFDKVLFPIGIKEPELLESYQLRGILGVGAYFRTKMLHRYSSLSYWESDYPNFYVTIGGVVRAYRDNENSIQFRSQFALQFEYRYTRSLYFYMSVERSTDSFSSPDLVRSFSARSYTSLGIKYWMNFKR